MKASAAPRGNRTTAAQIPIQRREFVIQMNNKRFTRTLSLLFVLALLIATLAGCGGNKTTVRTLTVSNVTLSAEYQKDDSGNLVLDENGNPKPANSLTANELSQIANMMASVFDPTEFDVQAMLVAAKRGYNMLDPSFDPKADAPDKGTPDLGAAMAVILAANEKAKDSNKVPVLPASINAYDLETLVNAFQTNVSIENKSGFFDTILGWLGKVLSWITNTLCFGSYLAGICVFAVIIEILMLPFAIKQQKNSIKQAQLRPKEMAIRKKYAGRNDQVTMQKMQQEIQEFYQKENFSPFSGCFQLLIQMPIIIALYNIVIDPLHYVLGQANTVSTALNTFYTTAKAAGGMGGTLTETSSIALLSRLREIGVSGLSGLADFEFFSNSAELLESVTPVLGRIPNFNIASINFGLKPSFEAPVLLLVPVLTFATYFLTSKLNRKFMYQPATNAGADERQVACSNSIMDITMPAMSTVFTFMVPALIGVYWIFRSLVGLVKQFIISRVMPLPQFTEEDYKAAAKEMAGKRVVQKSENVGKVRSLHYIDDEDFDDTRERALARQKAIAEREAAEAEAKNKKSEKGIEAAPVKEDDRNNANE